jgi:hypothetical protein
MFLQASDLTMPREDFIERIVDPMIARLLKNSGKPQEDVKWLHFRMWIAPVNEIQWSNLMSDESFGVEE